jgi:hypothetical protein
VAIFFRKTKRKLARESARLEQREGRLFLRERALAESDRALEDRRAVVAEQEADLEQREQTLRLLLESRVEGFAYIAQAWADWEVARAKSASTYLRRKGHAARKAAEVVREKGRELAEMHRRVKLAEYVVALYEWHFPWLVEFRDLEAEESYAVAEPEEEDERRDPAAHWLSAEEWKALGTAERNQRALERYLHSRKTPWQLGRDYERYIGYLREREGCRVTYHGIVKGFEDLGRDVLAERDGTLEVIQCKRWARHKEIHEKHVFQLFGTMVAARIENPLKKVTGTFTTTTSLSERAREFARVLEIRVEENFPLDDYPRIKCNIARPTGERIYHLPFDQQYDSTKIEPERGELYVSTEVQAEELQFRRAWRWRAEKQVV